MAKVIADEIRAFGPISFSRFMQQALYHPERGYYSSGRATIGRGGDYFTNVSVGPIFGKLIAAQFVEIWARLGRPADFTITEQGAHDGQFAVDVLGAIRETSPRLFGVVRYQIVEPFPIWQEKQRNVLREFTSKMSWATSVVELSPYVGIYFSNELLDAMPVNLRGKSIGLEADRFVFVETWQDIPPNESQLRWIDEIAAKLQRGIAIAMDYGFPRSEFREVVQVRAQHHLLERPFDQIGQADITVHINWTDIAERAERRGFRVAGFTDQHHFFTGIASQLSGDGLESFRDAKSTRELQTLLHPEMLGRAFQVLALSKSVDLAETLAGFRFARDGRTALELKP